MAEEDPQIETNEGADDEEATLGEDFRDVYNGFEDTRRKWMTLASKASGDKAAILQLLAGDLLPLLADFAALAGISVDALEEAIEAGDEDDEETEGVPRLGDQEATMVYVALLSGQQTLKALLGKLPPDAQAGISQLIETQEQALGVLRETYGQPLLDAAEAIVAQAVAP